jgi:enoyl-CoA hydratase/carnithine racemase
MNDTQQSGGNGAGLERADGPVLVAIRRATLWITINRPERRNALNAAVVNAIAAAIRGASAVDNLRAIVLTGAGDRAFCAGGDLAPNAEGAPFTVYPARPRNYVVDLLKTIEDCDLPIVGRVNGHALAGGLGLVCACDLVVASAKATFGTPESKIGLFPMMILPHMMRVLSRRRMMEMCITGDPLTAEEAVSVGLVNHIAAPEDLDAKVDWLLDRIVNRSPTAVRLGKMSLHAIQDMGLREALDYAQLMLPMMARTEDAREGTRAFQEKRPPVWTGR